MKALTHLPPAPLAVRPSRPRSVRIRQALLVPEVGVLAVLVAALAMLGMITDWQTARVLGAFLGGLL